MGWGATPVPHTETHMKLILSRKGFDSAAGGGPSPILPNGCLLSLPIPDRASPYTYGDICRHGGLDEKLVEDLSRGRVRADHGAHIDPDLNRFSLPRKPGWRPLFGQTRAAQAHLQNQGVGPGDIFLYYGWFRQTALRDGKLGFDRSAPDVHMLFGWLQADQVIPISSGCPKGLGWAAYHPHFHFQDTGRGKNNTLYVARKTLKLDGLGGRRIAGGGVFTHAADELRLTAPGRTRGTWLLPRWFIPTRGKPPLTYHRAPERWERTRQGVLLQTVGRGQEFVLDVEHHPEAVEWVRELIVGTG